MGTQWNRWWYNLTHKDKLPAGIERGFIAGRKFQSRLISAIVIAILSFLFTYGIGLLSPVLALLYSAIGIPAMIIGMYIGSALFKSKTDESLSKAMDYIEKVENKEVNLKKDLLKGAVVASQKVKEIKDEISNDLKEEKKVIQPEKKVEEKELSDAPDKEEEEKKDWRKGIEDFRKR